jgi:signal transduction histidine kinase
MTSSSGTPGLVAVVHGNSRRAEQLARLLQGAGHRVSRAAPGADLIQSVVRCSPDLLLVSQKLPEIASFVRAVRRALADDVRILVLYERDTEGTPPEADEVLCDEPLRPGELQHRVAGLVRELTRQRALQKKVVELLGLYKMSWGFSLAGGAESLYGQVTRHTADMLRAERGLLLLYDRARHELVAQPPGYGVTHQQLQRIRYPADGEARSRWDFRINGALLSNDAQTDARLLPALIKELGPRSLMIAPIIRGRAILGLLAVADRIGDAPFTDDDLELLRALAGQATIAVENLRLNEELHSANEQLQEFDRLKNQFVGIVAHDFRKPLMAIRGFAELVLEDPDLSAETRREFMRTVISESEQLAALANDTLLITQIETGQFRYSFREIDLGPFLLDAVPLGLADHSILVNVPAGFPRIWADPDRLRQVITNLVSNAVKYSPAGSTVGVRARPYDERQIAIEVEDNGIGIPPEQTGKLFQKFSRVRTEAHMKVSGTGLGLYICRLIVEGHGGHIWVQTEPRGGSTTFGFTLPLDARKVRAAEGEDAATPGTEVARAR